MLPVKQLLETHWQLAVEKVTAVGPVWRIETVQGDFCFKRGKHGLGRLFFDYHAIEYLWKQGFTGTPRLIPTVYGNPIIETEHGHFFLTAWVGRPLDASAHSEWKTAAAALGGFHHASKGVTFPPVAKPQSFSGKWTRRFAERTEELQAFLGGLSASRNEFEARIKQDSAQILAQAAEAAQRLQASAYERLVREVEAVPMLVHGNIKAENFSVENSGAVALIDFDSFRLDVPVQDLANLFQSVLPACSWSPDAALDVFHAYQTGRRVDPAEIPVLLAFLSFPHSVYKEIHKYTTQPDRPLAKCMRKWEPAVQEMYQTREFLQKWANPLKKCVQ
ncbi:CotS family spore coat protein [Tumebacillus sp. BK434]|uniref:CotS family spore coat protein n=1 Tax=Tumebacillus sp. BK434 TaxID=2512169 RepID=UPI0010D2AAA8|nr:CotS family spore coat protein [Tumebacillus sp. BK434]TCP55393.1 CotS family spore coat protein [Tumebacillus sp. BK434]